MATVIKPHKKGIEVDLTKPVDKVSGLNSAVEGECYTYLWMMDSNLCNICASFEICGILHTERLEKQVKQIEKDKGVTYLDNMHFNEIKESEVIQWLQHKPRTGKQFIDAIEKITKCSDRQTVVYWCQSFIKERGNISINEDKIIIVE